MQDVVPTISAQLAEAEIRHLAKASGDGKACSKTRAAKHGGSDVYFVPFCWLLVFEEIPLESRCMLYMKKLARRDSKGFLLQADSFLALLYEVEVTKELCDEFKAEPSFFLRWKHLMN